MKLLPVTRNFLTRFEHSELVRTAQAVGLDDQKPVLSGLGDAGIGQSVFGDSVQAFAALVSGLVEQDQHHSQLTARDAPFFQRVLAELLRVLLNHAMQAVDAQCSTKLSLCSQRHTSFRTSNARARVSAGLRVRLCGVLFDAVCPKPP